MRKRKSFDLIDREKAFVPTNGNEKKLLARQKRRKKPRFREGHFFGCWRAISNQLGASLRPSNTISANLTLSSLASVAQKSMEALQRRAPSAMRNSTSTTSTTLRHAHRRGRTPRAPRRGSASLRARAAVEGGDKEASPGLSQLASKVTALALAAAMALSSPFEVFASTLTPPPPTPSTSSSASSTSSTPPRSLVVITSTIDYERVARARSAMEKRKKREEAESVALLSDRGATSAGDPSSTSRRRQQDASSELPSPDEADALLQFDREAYTDDAWEAMKT